eukprot:NODE_26_length_35450_cov_0.398320.p19 type:complete len:164 gc:universal NODE_26_length_35450_cov_0.398320:187-678(+)
MIWNLFFIYGINNMDIQCNVNYMINTKSDYTLSNVFDQYGIVDTSATTLYLEYTSNKVISTNSFQFGNSALYNYTSEQLRNGVLLPALSVTSFKFFATTNTTISELTPFEISISKFKLCKTGASCFGFQPCSSTSAPTSSETPTKSSSTYPRALNLFLLMLLL